MSGKTINVSIQAELLDELDNRRRLQSVDQNKDITRSAYIRQVLKKALANQK